jgi:hypothetical protein
MKARFVLNLLLYRIRTFSVRHPWLFYTLYSLSPRNRRLMIRGDTELVIEGFPRSANTFAVVAFQYAQERDVQLAHHLHAQAQVLRGVEYGIPVCVLIREPTNAVRSLLVRHPHIPVRMALKAYIDFYTDILPLRDNCVIATFDEVTNDFGTVIERINKRFDTDFALFEPSLDALRQVISQIEAINRHVDKGMEEYVALPSEKRERLKRKITIAGSNDLARKAYGIYKLYLREAKAAR